MTVEVNLQKIHCLCDEGRAADAVAAPADEAAAPADDAPAVASPPAPPTTNSSTAVKPTATATAEPYDRVLSPLERESADTLIRFFIRFTCSKQGRDPSPLLRSRDELAAWIVYRSSREIRDWARYTVSLVRDTNRVLNEELQEQLTDETWKFWNHHTHLPSLFTKDYGGEGFARKRDREQVFCAQCGERLPGDEVGSPCTNCYAEGDEAREDWHTGWPGFRDEVTGPKRCCYWDRRDVGNVTVCSMCYEDGYIGKMFDE